jgi:hypothetical protein
MINFKFDKLTELSDNNHYEKIIQIKRSCKQTIFPSSFQIDDFQKEKGFAKLCY